LNNYKKQPFIPAIQKTSTLVALSLLSLVCFIVSINAKTIDVSPSYSHKVEAANLMKKAMEILKSHRMEQSVFIDVENDPNETGLVGDSFSLITTDEGDLDSKLTTLDPNFSAAIVELMDQLNLKKNDTVAVLMTGSMPGANMAVLAACKTLDVFPVSITSVGASQWGANQVDFTWLDMESILFNNDMIPARSVAASIGGRNDMGRLLSPAGRKIITENIKAHGLHLIRKDAAELYFENSVQWIRCLDPSKLLAEMIVSIAPGHSSRNLRCVERRLLCLIQDDQLRAPDPIRWLPSHSRRRCLVATDLE